MSLWYSSPDDRRFAGLRAGWRLTLFFIIALAPTLAVLALRPAARGHHGAPPVLTPLTLIAAEGFALGWTVLATYILLRLEHRRWSEFGLPGRGAFGRQFWWGVLWGAGALSLVLVLMAASGAYSFGSLATQGSTLARYAVAWAIAFLAVGIYEEFFFRGYALVTLAEGTRFWTAAIILSFIFGFVHLGNGGESWIGAVTAGLIGLFFCFTFRRTGSLWFAVGLHAAWDYCESFVYGVPDSGTIAPGRLLQPSFHGSHWLTGGTVGPEGSIWALLVIALLFWAFGRWKPQPAAAVFQPRTRAITSSSEP